MGLFDAFTGGSAIKGANKGYAALAKGLKAARGDITSNIGAANTGIQNAQQASLADVNAGVNQAGNYLTGVGDLYKGLAPGDMSARAMLLNSLGLNGPGGNAAAVGAFQNSPGFQAALDAAQNAEMRYGANLGSLDSGATRLALQKRAMDAQNLDYGNWQNRLTNQANNIYQDYAGQASSLGDLANLFANKGRTLADIRTNAANNVANNTTNLAQLLAGNDTSMGQAGYQRASDVANAQAQGNQNIWGAILGLGKLASSFA